MKSINANLSTIRRRFDLTFKREAVQNWPGSGKSAEVIGGELGISAGHLYAWRAYRFRACEEASTFSTGTILPVRRPTAAPDSAPGEASEEIAEARLIENKLRRAAAEGSFLVLAVPRCRMLMAERELLRRFDLDRRNVDELVIRALRADAQAVLPTLDGQPVPVLSAAQWTHLTEA